MHIQTRLPCWSKVDPDSGSERQREREKLNTRQATQPNSKGRRWKDAKPSKATRSYAYLCTKRGTLQLWEKAPKKVKSQPGLVDEGNLAKEWNKDNDSLCAIEKVLCTYTRGVCVYIYILHTSTIYKKHVSLSICAFGKGSLDVRAPSYRFSKKWRKPNTTISTSSHLHTITSQASSHHNITTSSHIITSQHHHSTASPYHHIAASPHHRITTSSHRPRWCLKVRNRTSPYVFPRNASSLWAVPILVRPSPKYWPERSLDRSVFPHLPGEGPYLLLLHLLPSTASSRSQWAVGTAGPQPQAPDLSGHCKHQISVGTAGPQE